MTHPTETDRERPKALELADWLQSAVQTYPQMSEDEPGGYCSELDQQIDFAASELRTQHAELEALRKEVERERASRQAAQIQNEALKDENIRLNSLRDERDGLRAEVERLTLELDAQRLYARALCTAVDTATDFAGTVAGGSSWWDDVWAEQASALDRARDRITIAAQGVKG